MNKLQSSLKYARAAALLIAVIAALGFRLPSAQACPVACLSMRHLGGTTLIASSGQETHGSKGGKRAPIRRHLRV